jgi:hypothetical protein
MIEINEKCHTVGTVQTYIVIPSQRQRTSSLTIASENVRPKDQHTSCRSRLEIISILAISLPSLSNCHLKFAYIILKEHYVCICLPWLKSELFLQNYKCGGYVPCCVTVNTHAIVNWTNSRNVSYILFLLFVYFIARVWIYEQWYYMVQLEGSAILKMWNPFFHIYNSAQFLQNYKCGGYVPCCVTVNTHAIVNWTNSRNVIDDFDV